MKVNAGEISQRNDHDDPKKIFTTDWSCAFVTARLTAERIVDFVFGWRCSKLLGALRCGWPADQSRNIRRIIRWRGHMRDAHLPKLSMDASMIETQTPASMRGLVLSKSWSEKLGINFISKWRTLFISVRVQNDYKKLKEEDRTRGELGSRNFLKLSRREHRQTSTFPRWAITALKTFRFWQNPSIQFLLSIRCSVIRLNP